MGTPIETSLELLVVGSKVRATIREAGFNTSGDFFEGLNNLVHDAIRRGTQRAAANRRRTVRAHDVWLEEPLETHVDR